MRIQDLIFIIILLSSNTTSFSFHCSSVNWSGVQCARSRWLWDCCKPTSRVCAPRLDPSQQSFSCCSVHIIEHIYRPSDYSSHETEDVFYQNLFWIMKCLHLLDFVVDADDFNVHFGCFLVAGKSIGFPFLSQSINARTSIVSVRLLVANTNLLQKETWALNPDWSNFHWWPVAWIIWRPSIILFHTSGLKSRFGQG